MHARDRRCERAFDFPKLGPSTPSRALAADVAQPRNSTSKKSAAEMTEHLRCRPSGFQEGAMRRQFTIIGMFITAALACPGLSQATPITLDAGSFTATYHPQAFSGGWSVGSSFASVDGWDLQSSQFQVSTGSNRLRIDFVELPPHAPDPSLDNRTGAVTQLSVSSAGHYDGKAQLKLPVTLRADAEDETAYRISLGMSVSGSAYTPFVLPGVFTTPILSQVSGSLSTGYGNAETSTTPLLVTVPATEMVFSQYVAPGDAVTAISGVFAARGGYVKGVTACARKAIRGSKEIMRHVRKAMPKPINTNAIHLYMPHRLADFQ
jgi:hypothetical protein